MSSNPNEGNLLAFEKMPVLKALAKFILPAVAGQIAGLILNITDTFFVGRTGDTAQISAMTVTFPLIMFMTCVVNIFGIGANANVAAAIAKRDIKRAKNYSAFSFYAAMIMIAIISAIILAFETPVITVLGADAQSSYYCRGYLLWAMHIPCCVLVGAQVFAQLFMAEGEAKVSGFGVTLCGITNIILDPIFIFGFKLGIIGAGVATCIADFVMMGYFIFMYVKKRKTAMISVNPKLFKIKDGIAAGVILTGFPGGLSILIMNFADILRNHLFAVYGGQLELAAWGTIIKLAGVFIQLTMGICLGVRPLVAYNYSAKNYDRTKKLITSSVVIMIIYSTIATLISVVAPEPMIRIFLPVEDAIPVASHYARVWMSCFIGMSVVELLNSIFQAMGKWKVAMASVIIDKVFLYVPAMLILSNSLGITGVLMGQPVSENVTVVLLAIVCVMIFRKENNEKGPQ
ncbi:MAG: hypothetical protein K6E56_00175 [Lachnospiraceae bacterium]|nr:hypothetical protein [Lachnospiraceae bacterium]